jgi:hypothetical protein
MAHISKQLRADINGVRMAFLGVGVVAVLLSLISLLIAPQLFYRAYLVAYTFTFAFAAGGLASMLLRHLAGGAWSVAMQRVSEAAAKTLWVFLPIMGLLFLLGKGHLYPWTNPEYVAAHSIVQAKEIYLNEPFFLIRMLAYFAIWLLFGWSFCRWSNKMDETGDPKYAVWMQKLSAVGIILYFATMTLASTDWGMSTEPAWYSTIYGPQWIVNQGLSIIALSIIVLSYLHHESPVREAMTTKTWVDLGNMMLGFVVLWTYITFSQFLIIWSGNLPELIPWYLNRSAGPWIPVAFILTLFHFVLPLIVLLFRRTKSNIVPLRRIAFFVLAMRFVDLYWVLVPSFSGNENTFSEWTLVFSLLAVAGLFSIWMWYFLGQLVKRPLIPEQDPRAVLLLQKEKREAQSHA